jgi:hypothetical protein
VTTARLTLTDTETERLQELAERTGKTQDQLLHDAVGSLLSQVHQPEWLAAMQQARGMWRDRTDLPDFAALRDGFDRT